MLLVAATVGLAFFALVGTAAAYTNDGRAGKPGKLVSIYKIEGSHYSWGWGLWNLWFWSNGPTVARSPATSGRQRISAEFQFYRWQSGGWRYQTKATVGAPLARGYRRIRLPHMSIFPSGNYGHWGAYIVFRWHGPQGRLLGRRSIDMNQRRDYKCSTQFTSKCQVRDGWVWVASPHS